MATAYVQDILDLLQRHYPEYVHPDQIAKTIDFIYETKHHSFERLSDFHAALVQDAELDDPGSNRRVAPEPKKKKGKKRTYRDHWIERPCSAYIPTGSVPNSIYGRAEIMHDRVGVELMALGKPAGGIFNPDHWMYDCMRDHFSDVLDDALGIIRRNEIA